MKAKAHVIASPPQADEAIPLALSRRLFLRLLRRPLCRTPRNDLFYSMMLALIMLFSMPMAVYAQPPSLPHGFYGTVKINNVDAPVGTVIEARVPGALNDETNPYVTIEPGKYGSANPLAIKPRLLVQGDIAPGAAIEFFINGVKANETAVWQSGQTTVMNLTVGVAPPPVTIPPEVFTGNAASVTETSATLFGTLSGLGTATTVNVSFEWGDHCRRALSQP
ncbi:MAG: hypothetical protein HY668_00180 [Chloroflexi bacterium]|nr:hypothetical protein [Chloroflexota bacterium]